MALVQLHTNIDEEVKRCLAKTAKAKRMQQGAIVEEALKAYLKIGDTGISEQSDSSEQPVDPAKTSI